MSKPKDIKIFYLTAFRLNEIIPEPVISKKIYAASAYEAKKIFLEDLDTSLYNPDDFYEIKAEEVRVEKGPPKKGGCGCAAALLLSILLMLIIPILNSTIEEIESVQKNLDISSGRSGMIELSSTAEGLSSLQLRILSLAEFLIPVIFFIVILLIIRSVFHFIRRSIHKNFNRY